MTATATSAAAELLGVERFAAGVLHRPLWPHQLDVALCPARYRVICAGRQVGKSALLAVLALHAAATRRNVLVLVVSAGEDAAKRLLADVAAMARERLAGSVLDDSRSVLTLSNGSSIRSVPASDKQIRGWPVDVLMVDEAGFISNELWQSAEPTILARPGSRVIVCSSPWGGVDHWFRTLWRRGMDRPDEHVAAWHWPSDVSPLVDRALLADLRERTPADVFAREYLAEWADAVGAYFGEDELMAATADYATPDPVTLPVDRRFPVAAGIDWSGASGRDSHALTLLARMNRTPDGQARLYVAHQEAGHSRQPFGEFIDRVVEVAGSYRVRVAASERNGVGEYPTAELERRLWAARTGTRVAPVWTTARHKMSGFGRIKGLLQSGRLVLPMAPELLRELRALRFEQLAGGVVRIAVPEAGGLHDDRAMSLLQAITTVEPAMLRDGPAWPGRETVTAGAGFEVPARPMPDPDRIGHITIPDGEDEGDGW